MVTILMIATVNALRSKAIKPKTDKHSVALGSSIFIDAEFVHIVLDLKVETAIDQVGDITNAVTLGQSSVPRFV